MTRRAERGETVNPTSVLLLAGTTEASDLARLLDSTDGVEVLASLAGRTRAPAELPCPVRIGGFGGVHALAADLGDGHHHLLVDATHPFAAQMPHNAATAARIAGVPRLRLLRPPWQPVDGDDWHRVADLSAAARKLEELGARRVLLTVGRMSLVPFADLEGVHLVARSIEVPDEPTVPGATLILDRGPFDVGSESALLHDHAIDVLVTKNSGGAATSAKLVAAHQAGVSVVMVDRPSTPAGPVAETPVEAMAWIDSHRR